MEKRPEPQWDPNERERRESQTGDRQEVDK
jgi:hypothetical protein